MLLYRIQHKQTGLGPYEHPQQGCLRAFRNNIDVMPDVDEAMADTLKHNPTARFAFTERTAANRFIKNEQLMADYGFELIELDIEPLIVVEGQALFLPISE